MDLYVIKMYVLIDTVYAWVSIKTYNIYMYK